MSLANSLLLRIPWQCDDGHKTCVPFDISDKTCETLSGAPFRVVVTVIRRTLDALGHHPIRCQNGVTFCAKLVLLASQSRPRRLAPAVNRTFQQNIPSELFIYSSYPRTENKSGLFRQKNNSNASRHPTICTVYLGKAPINLTSFSRL